MKHHDFGNGSLSSLLSFSSSFPFSSFFQGWTSLSGVCIVLEHCRVCFLSAMHPASRQPHPKPPTLTLCYDISTSIFPSECSSISVHARCNVCTRGGGSGGGASALCVVCNRSSHLSVPYFKPRLLPFHIPSRSLPLHPFPVSLPIEGSNQKTASTMLGTGCIRN